MGSKSIWESTLKYRYGSCLPRLVYVQSISRKVNAAFTCMHAAFKLIQRLSRKLMHSLDSSIFVLFCKIDLNEKALLFPQIIYYSVCLPEKTILNIDEWFF